MKKNILCTLAFFAFSFISCQEDSMIENSSTLQEEQNVKIYTYSGEQNSESRVALNDAELYYYWQTNDSLSVFMRDGKNRHFHLVEGAGTTRGGFMGLIWGGAGDSSSDLFPNNVAYYPYNKNLIAKHLGDGVYSLTSTLPFKQSYGGDGTFAQYVYPMIGVTEDNSRINYKMKAVTSFVALRLRLHEEENAETKINKIILKANGYKIAGDFIVKASYENDPETTTGQSAVDYVALECIEPVQLNKETAVNFTFVALPIDYSENTDALSVDIYDNNGGYMKDLKLQPFGSDSYALQRGEQKNFGLAEGKYIYYKAEDSFIKMLKRAKSGQVIDYTLPGDITLTETAPINAGVTLNLDLDGHTITSDIAGNAWTLANNSVLNVKNGTLKNVEKEPMSSPALIRSKSGDNAPSSITLENVVIENNIKVNSSKLSYAILSPSTGNITLTDVTMTSAGHGIKFVGHTPPQGNGLVINSGIYTAERNVLAQGSNGSLYGTIYNGYFKSINHNCISVSTDGTNTGIRIVDGYFSDNKFEYIEWAESGNSEYPYQAIDAGWKQTDENNYEIYNVRGLKWFRDQVNEGNSFSNQTVTLITDLDLKNEIWEPIGTLNPKNYFKGTFDGGNKTISNLEVNVADGAAGLFGAVQNCVAIKNVTVVNANIKSNHYAGVIVGWLQENGSTRVPTVSNCMVKQATITVTPSNGDYGDKAGAIVGYAASETKIDECSASDVQITGYRDLGGIVGMANSTVKNGYVTISNNKVESITINYSAEGAYQETPTTFGEIYGRGDANLSDNTIIGVTINWPEEVCAFINGKGYLSINDAITAAVDNDVISVKEGTYKEILNVKGGKIFTIKPAEEDAIVKIAGIDHQTSAVNQASTVTFENLTIDNTLQNDLTGWYTGTSQKMKVCVGIWGGNLTFNHCKFFVSEASGAETGVMTWWTAGNLATLTFNDCEFDGVSDRSRAMQIYGTVNLKVDGCTFKTKKDYSLKYVGGEGCTAEFSGNYVSNTENFVQLGSATYPGKNYIVSFNHNTLEGSVNLYKIDNEENQTIYVDNVNVYPGYEKVNDNEYNVFSAKGLSYFADQKLENVTLNILNDIDFDGAEFKAIAAAYGKTLTINGNGKTIKNIKVVSGTNDNSTGQASLFYTYTGSTLTVNNLKVDNIEVDADINGSGYAGAIVGYAEGKVILNNVDVNNADVYGEKSCAVLVGFVTASSALVEMTDCNVTNSKVEAKEDRTGAYIGRSVGIAKIENSSVDNNFISIAPDGWNNKYIGQRYESCSSLTIDGNEYVDAKYGLTAAIGKATSGATILVAGGTYEGLMDVSQKSLNLVAFDGTPEFNGLVWADNCTVTLKGFKLSNPDGVKHPNPSNSQYYTTINNQYPLIGAYLSSNITMEDCTFDIVGPTVYGFYGYAANKPVFKNCTFNCNGIRPIASNGPALTITGCTFNDQYHYSARIYENSGEMQTIVYTNNTVQGSNTKGEFEGINISKKASTATVVGDFTIKDNTPDLKYRHHKDVTMSESCTYDTDIIDFKFEKEQ